MWLVRDCKVPHEPLDLTASQVGAWGVVVVSGSQIRGSVSPDGGRDSPGRVQPERPMSAGRHG